MSSFVFQTAPQIVCAQGAALRLHELAQSFGAQHVFFVTDRGVLDAGIATGPLAALRRADIQATVFSDVQADPPEAVVLQAAEAARAAGADMVIGFGGGSSMDTAKLVALLARTPQQLGAIYGIGLAAGPRLPLIQVPTTAGTGSEVTPISIVTTPTSEKKGVVTPLLLPDAAVLDSLLTLGVPPAVTAMTGVDAMVHAIEAFTSRHKKNAISDALAVKALQLLYGNLREVAGEAAGADARERMLLGSMLAGMAFANAPVAAVHALAYPLGGHYHLPHGLSNSLMLTAVLRFNLSHATAEYAALGRAILPALATAPDAEAAERFVQAITDITAGMPYAQSLRAAGIPRDALPRLAGDAMKQQRLLVNNPRDVTHDDALRLYEAAF
ncbi:iron-containing alcohol dehydrogenase [Cupriavidus basilensis]|uniref:iron-containing alcohol dehydrogenase n=1 Tax=Cupriavidus basilensis TaxID=68895 RepID=UPI000750E4B6|nr:iron-containing alcohol dehydrogenase [Cupriavidus basilensis]